MTSDFAIAVHALVFLNHRQTSLSSEQIAENVCTHPVRIRRVLAKLKKADLIETREGQNGGYAFHKNANQVSLQQIAAALKETAVNVKLRTGDLDMDCAVASGMAAIMDNVYDHLNRACTDYLSTITIDMIDKNLFSGGDSRENNA